ncbi:MAG: UDP-N-acetylmuramoyl-L-alanyl-D-glutamate--2,6-diaminopimelate ligase [Rhodospirillales bacterium]|nr:UDP-N-acetylmuramoyl-L-alanyl-D-glutamate--2,6-diaminopimelate ligase [Rhodospirillales bacterium]MBT4040361.1 UDP-N-acetylmuramoyl-L-alanyl-D-glutamate--2,6-diaminopimelate ligase [Rhodospirillales bacterium]MBT5519361.1 UDP-N-acetylmuramoyl-L-alanyl-D-glutamate--2,6-diaminopimelate ligase [Rhodospirillales bacterium]MBT6110457.1 UDP-N-acetylmuramoyl-L-alanyl-D-glutamate--2,6-diaminopimelate ligase [Rhodospirillales bacterium]MBT6826052.1 UDP-N-acetylmuramoyl-L-alanyl-D-glutamate--2,6-diami
MKLAELAEGIDGQVNSVLKTSDVDITGITSDSRQVMPGYLFAAIPGSVADGSDFIPQAIENGAAAILLPRNAVSVPDVADLSVIAADNTRQQYAKLSARFYGRQPKTIAAITGTNGKTSVATFLRQIWNAQGLMAGSTGTLGSSATGDGLGLYYPGALTTPDSAELHRILSDMTDHGVEHLAMEASSHGLDQYRLDGARISLAAFTNLSRDHLDYHGTEENYFAAKKRLFTELLKVNGTAVINADALESISLRDVLDQRGITVIDFGRTATYVRLVDQEATGSGQNLELEIDGKIYRVELPLIGEFQASNVMCALGLALASGCAVSDCVGALSKLRGVRGRLEHAGTLPNGASIYVDYAHTPDALVTVLRAVRQHTAGQLHVVFGCGGDRDSGKRKPMGEAAAMNADQVILTDDNPRSEDPAVIRKQAMSGCPGALEIGDRYQAIETAIGNLSTDDLLVVAGKGHEQGQTVGDQVHTFDDVSVIREIIRQVSS